MSKVKVTFQPGGVHAEADPGEKLIDIASDAGVEINNQCGGQGVCGKCRVKIKHGNAKLTGNAAGPLTAAELAQGFVLACKAEVQGSEIEVWVPPESRNNVDQIQISDYLVASGVPIDVDPAVPAPFFRPLCQKLYLELPPPTLTDSLSDLDRIYRALRKIVPELPNLQAHNSCLWGLGNLLRKNDWKITATIHFRDSGCPNIREIEGGDTSEHNYGMAIDIGTTTIVAQLIDLHTGAVVAVQACNNSQARYGEDVISRMIHAGKESGLERLTEAVIYSINSLIDSLVKKKKIQHKSITAFVAAGNTVMSHLLLGLDPSHIRLAPYIPVAARFPQLQAAEAGLRSHKKALLHCMPCVSSYIGGDITAGVLACGMSDQPEISALIDVGTNGEVVIGNNEWLVCCSSSAGPAFEGAGIKCGMRATRGAIEKIYFKDEQVLFETIGQTKPVGLCGSAIIDIIAELLSAGIIDQSGRFINLDHPRVNVNGDIPQFTIVPPGRSASGESIVITEDDISNLIRTKGALLASLRVLLQSMGLGFNDLQRVYVAGGFGAHLDIEKAIFIGLLPDIPIDRIRFIGNSSLAGARYALLSTHAFHKAEQIAAGMTYFELSINQDFMNEFIASLFLPHTDMNLFPSVKAKLERLRDCSQDQEICACEGRIAGARR